jgi:hypothetical protein
MPVSLSLPTVRFYSSGHCAIPRTRRVSIAAAFRPEVWRGRRIAPTREGPRNESSNRAHDSTSGRSTHYASGYLIRVFRGIGHIFSSLYPFRWQVLFLSRFGRRPGFVTLRQTFVRGCQTCPQLALLVRRYFTLSWTCGMMLTRAISLRATRPPNNGKPSQGAHARQAFRSRWRGRSSSLTMPIQAV